jgi:xanthine dehydrogenase small subunit
VAQVAEQEIRFILDGKTVRASHVAPTTTLLQFLRDRLGRTGTKEGCAEGDCGACTVVVGELTSERIRYRAVNSCIRFLPTLDGKEVVSVESLKAPDGTLHPVQRAMVDCHASQCGFCTPGFVMSLFALYLNQNSAQRSQVVSALTGNLCRCTGYRPIIEAGRRMYDYAPPPVWSREEAQSSARRSALRALERGKSLALDTGFRSPTSSDELAHLYAAHPDALLLGGGTDVGLWVTKQLRSLPMLIYIGNVVELQVLREADGVLDIGAAVSLTDAYEAIVTRYPMLAEIAERFGSPPVRNAGTLGGNVANGSPIGDSMPFLMVLGATLRLRRGERRRELPLESFYLGYQKKALEPGEFLEAVCVPLPRPGRLFASYKVSKRFDQDISAVCGAFAVDLEGGRVASVRIAFGGMAAIPQRAPLTEAALVGKPWSQQTVLAALPALERDYTPLSDMRASAGYRLLAARNLLRRFFLGVCTSVERRYTRTTFPQPAHSLALGG